MMTERQGTCCFTGHRILSKEELLLINRRLRELLKEKISEGYRCFAAGGALGFDTVAALTVLELKKDFPEIELKLILPHKNQCEGWSKRDVETYQNILEQADQVEYLWEDYVVGCYHMRNRALVNCSDCCICYLRSHGGGTEYTVNYAHEQGIQVYNLVL